MFEKLTFQKHKRHLTWTGASDDDSNRLLLDDARSASYKSLVSFGIFRRNKVSCGDQKRKTEPRISFGIGGAGNISKFENPEF